MNARALKALHGFTADEERPWVLQEEVAKSAAARTGGRTEIGAWFQPSPVGREWTNQVPQSGEFLEADLPAWVFERIALLEARQVDTRVLEASPAACGSTCIAGTDAWKPPGGKGA